MGIIGGGNIATLNVPGYLEHDHCEVVAPCDPRADVLERRSHEWGVDRCYTELDEILGDAAVDAVAILSPTPLRVAHTIAGLQGGTHVSWQKPIANSVADARAAVAAARTSGKMFRVT